MNSFSPISRCRWSSRAHGLGRWPDLDAVRDSNLPVRAVLPEVLAGRGPSVD